MLMTGPYHDTGESDEIGVLDKSGLLNFLSCVSRSSVWKGGGHRVEKMTWQTKSSQEKRA